VASAFIIHDFLFLSPAVAVTAPRINFPLHRFFSRDPGTWNRALFFFRGAGEENGHESIFFSDSRREKNPPTMAPLFSSHQLVIVKGEGRPFFLFFPSFFPIGAE